MYHLPAAGGLPSDLTSQVFDGNTAARFGRYVGGLESDRKHQDVEREGHQREREGHERERKLQEQLSKLHQKRGDNLEDENQKLRDELAKMRKEKAEKEEEDKQKPTLDQRLDKIHHTVRHGFKKQNKKSDKLIAGMTPQPKPSKSKIFTSPSASDSPSSMEDSISPSSTNGSTTTGSTSPSSTNTPSSTNSRRSSLASRASSRARGGRTSLSPPAAPVPELGEAIELLLNLFIDKPSEAMKKHGLLKGDLVEVTGNTDKYRRGLVIGFKATTFVYVLYNHDWAANDIFEKVLDLKVDADSRRQAAVDTILRCKSIKTLSKVVKNGTGGEEFIASPFFQN